jgi:hypothetical protein
MTMKLNRQFTSAVEGYCGGDVLHIETVADPQVLDTFAIKATVKLGEQNPFDLFFLVRGASAAHDLVDAIEEVEFTEWPPVAGRETR